MIERLDVTHLLKSSNKQYWVGHLDKFGKYLDRIAAYFRASVCRHKLAALVKCFKTLLLKATIVDLFTDLFIPTTHLLLIVRLRRPPQT